MAGQFIGLGHAAVDTSVTYPGPCPTHAPCPSQALTEKDLPPGRLVDACRAWYAASTDPRVLVPVAFTLSRREVVGLLPAMLRALPAQGLKKLYRSLASRHGEGGLALS